MYLLSVVCDVAVSLTVQPTSLPVQKWACQRDYIAVMCRWNFKLTLDDAWMAGITGNQWMAHGQAMNSWDTLLVDHASASMDDPQIQLIPTG